MPVALASLALTALRLSPYLISSFVRMSRMVAREEKETTKGD